MLKIQDIRRVQVELTTRCNARCPMCMRNYRGSDYNSGYPLCELSLADFKKIIDPALLKQLQTPDTLSATDEFVGVLFNGNLGDFSSAQDGLEIVQYLVNHGVRVQINTNGSARNQDWWERLALPGVTVGFALDGLADTHSLYRQDTDWHRVTGNARAFVQAGGRAVWRFIAFDHNRHQESQCQQLARDWGFAKFENISEGRDQGPVFTRNGEFSHYLGAAWPVEPRIQDLLQGHVTWYNKDTFRSDKDRPDLEIRCWHKRTREIYLAADGTVYPCCYLGFYPGQMQHPGNQELAPLVQRNNALHYDLAQCMQWFDQVEAAWQHSSIAQGRPYQCVQSCGRVPQHQ